MITIALSQEQLSALTNYLILSRGYRKDQAYASHKLAKEMNKDGTPKFSKMQKNAEFWDEMNADIESALTALIQSC